MGTVEFQSGQPDVGDDVPPGYQEALAAVHRAPLETDDDVMQLWASLNATNTEAERSPLRIAALEPEASWTKQELENLRRMLTRFRSGYQPDVIGDRDRNNEWRDCVAVGDGVEWWGSGTLVAQNLILTAAHVRTHPADSTRRVTHVCFGVDVRSNDRVLYAIANEPHVYSTPRPPANATPDLMVLVLKESVPESVAVPRTIAPANTLDDETAIDSVKVVGYGGSSPGSGTVGHGTRRKVDVPLKHRLCELADQPEYSCHAGYEFVCGHRFLNKGVCPGDSGGPTYVLVPATRRWELAGVTRRTVGVKSRPCGDMSVHIRLDKEDFVTWMRAIPGGKWE